MQRYTAGLGCACMLGAIAVAGAGCQDFLPANPYDPQAPAHVQARGEIRGVVFVDDAEAEPAVLQAVLDATAVKLFQADGRELASLTCASQPAAGVRITCTVADRRATFAFAQLPAGGYRVSVEGMDPAYAPLSLPPIALLPGEIEDLGVLRYRRIPLDQTQPAGWTGRVTGVATLSAGQGGPRRITLLRRGSSGLEAHAVAVTDSLGRFNFDGVPPGLYAVSAELEQHTPDYRIGFAIQGADVPVENNTQAFTGSDGLLLHPVTAVLIPALQQTFGHYYTRDDTAPVQVLQFGGMNQMRVSADPSFASGTVTWVDYAASADVALPGVEGAIGLHAQFRNTTVDGFSFESSVYRTEVIRDVSAPVVESVRLRGRAVAQDGRVWLSTEGETLGLEIDGSDAISAVYQVALHHDAQNAAGDPATLVYDLVNSPGGPVRMTREQTLTAGEGEKVVFVYLRDRAGNTSAASSVSLWIDATPPVVDGLVLAGGASITGQSTIPVTVLVSDANVVVGMQVWEEGQPVPGVIPYSEGWTVQLQALNLAHTTRQVNAVVWDRAGNPSLMTSSSIVFDNRGRLTGTLWIEDAADGSAGDSSGVTALVDGVSFDGGTQFTATGNRGEFDFVVSGVPAGANRTLVYQKAGYAEARSSSPATVEAGATIGLGLFRLQRARGTIAGWAKLDTGTDHSGIVVTAQGTTLRGSTDSSGYFEIADVPAGSGYTLVFRYNAQHSVATRTGVNVPASGTVQVSSGASPVMLVTLVGGVAVHEGAHTNSQDVTLDLFYQGAVEYRASEDATFADGSGGELDYVTFAGAGCTANAGGLFSCPFRLSSGEGEHAVYVQFRDPGGTGFTSDTTGVTTVLDTVPPEAGSVEIDGGKNFTNALNVSVAVSSTDTNGIATMQVGVDGTPWLPEEAYLTSFTQPVTGPDGLKCVFVRFKDPAGNWSDEGVAAASDCTTLDRVAPEPGSPALSLWDLGGALLNDGLTTSANLFLTASATSAHEMRFSNSASFTGSVWQPYGSGAVFWTVPPGEGLRKVYVEFRDEAGNVVGGAGTLDAAVTVDSVPPGAPVFTVAQGAFTSTTTVHLNLNNWTSGETVLFQSNQALDSTQSAGAAATLGFVLPSVEGLHLLSVRYRDVAGNESTASQVAITLDRQAPTGTLHIDDSATFSTSTTGQVTLGIVATDSSSGLRRMRFSNDGSTWDLWQTAASTYGPWTLASPSNQNDVPKTVYLQLEDNVGNTTTASIFDTIRLDNVAPDASPLSINGGVGQTNTTLVTLTFSATAATEMKLSPGGSCVGGGWEGYVEATTPAPYPWVLDGDGSAVYASVRFRDAAGNPSTCAYDSIAVDLTSPELPSVVIDGSAMYSNSPTDQLSVALSATGASAYRIAETAAGVESATWVSPVPAAAFLYTLSTGNRGDGEKTLFVQFRDSADNLSVVVSDSIVHDATIPEAGYLLVDNGAAFSRSGTGQVSLYFGGNDALSGLAAVEVSNDGTTWSTEQTYTGYIASWTLAAPTSDVDGALRTVRVRLTDRAGNVSDAESDDITLDNVQPTGTITVNGTAEYTASQAVQVVVSPSADVELVALANDTQPNCETAAYTGLQDIYSWTLSAGDSPAPGPAKTVYACFRDRAGNSSSPPSLDAIRLDTARPTFTALTQYPAGTKSQVTSDVDGALRVVVTLDAEDQAAVAVSANALGVGSSATGSVVAGQTVADLDLDVAPAATASDGSYVLEITATDAAGNSASELRTVLVDRTPPTLSSVTCPACAECEGRLFVRGTAVALLPMGFDDLSGIARFEARDASGTLVHSVGQGENLTFDLVATEGTAQAYNVRAYDVAGLPSDPIALSMVHDAAAPSLLLELDGGALFTARSSVEVSLVLTDGNLAAFPECYGMRYAWGAAPTGTWGPYMGAFPSTVNSPGSDDDKTLHVEVRDPADRRTSGSETIALDTSAPTVAIDVTAVGGDDDYTRQQVVDVALAYSNDTAGYKLVPGFDDCTMLPRSAFTPLAPASTTLTLPGFDLGSVPGVLPMIDLPEGNPVTLKACFRDRADNRASGSDSITLDRVPLQGAVIIDGDSAWVTDTSVDLTLAVDASDTDLMFVCNGSNTTTCLDGDGPCLIARTFVDTYASTKSWTLSSSGGDGTKYVLACLQDDAGHRTQVWDEVALDSSAPAPAALVIRGRVGFSCCFQGEFCTGMLNCSESTGKARLPVAVLEFGFAVANPYTGVDVATGNGDQECDALSGWAPFAPTGSCQDAVLGGAGYQCQRVEQWALSEAEGDVTVTVCMRDPAGLTTQLTDTIEVDRTAPSEASITDASAGNHTVSLSWEGSASSDLVGYRVKWFQPGYPMSWVQQVDPELSIEAHLDSLTESRTLVVPAGHDAVLNCQPVELRVMAFDDAGNWSFSAPATVTPLFPAPGNVRVVGHARELQASWDPVSGAGNYRVYVASSSDVAATAQGYLQVPGGTNSLAIRDEELLTSPANPVDLQDNRTYHVAVAARDGNLTPECYSDLSASDSDVTRALLLSEVRSGSIHEAWFGSRVATADLDHDGHSELIVSSPAAPDVYYSGNNLVQAENAGVVEILSGRTGSRVFLANGARPNEYAGLGLAVLDDLDRDGWSEFAVGRPGWEFVDATALNNNRGRVDLYSGRTGFLMKSLYAPVPTDGDEYGYAIASAGDFVLASGAAGTDGIDEFAIAAPGWGSGAGRIFFYNGATQGELALRRRTGQAGERYGESLHPAVSRAGGGVLLAASTSARTGFQGVVRVFRPFFATDVAELQGTAARPLNGALALIDAFGTPETNLIAVGMPGASEGPRVARYSYDGATVTPLADVTSPYASTIAFGSALAWASVLGRGDVPDLVVAGSDQGVGTLQGRLALYQHDATLAARLALEFRAGTPGGRFGSSLAVGRFDNSGVDQLAVGAPELFVGNFKAGGVFIVGHSMLQVSPFVSASVRLGQIRFASTGGTPVRSLAFAAGGNLSGAPELDGTDLYQAGGNGSVEDTLLLTDAKDRQLTIRVPVVKPADALGSAVVSSVCGAGEDCGIGATLAIIHDVDGDGHRDLAVGAPLYPPAPAANPQRGALLVVSGAAGFPNNTLLARVDNPVAEVFPAEFGSSIAVVDDLDGDGIGEIAVGAPRADYGGFEDSGRVDVFSGGSISTSALLLYSFGGSETTQRLGASMAFLGNHNDQDGSDLAVGNPWYGSGPDAASGLVCIANLTPAGITQWYSSGLLDDFCTPQDPGNPLDRPWNRIEGNPGDLLGQSLAGGDVSGDGVPDLIVGAPKADNGSRTDAGRVLVYLGSRYQNIQGQIALDLAGTSTSAWLGWAVTVSSDFDDDGSRELLVGAPADSSRGFTRGGSIHVVSTRSGGSLHSAHGTENYSYFGAAVAVADFNRDGHADWVVGAPGDPSDLYGDDGDIYLVDGSTGIGQNVYPGPPGQGQMWGYSLAAGADVDGDGFEDFVAGTPGRRTPAMVNQPGGAKLFFTCTPNNSGGICP